MRHSRRRPWLMTACAPLMVLAACSDSALTDVEETAAGPLAKWACVDPDNPHCLPGEDPDPDQPGVYLQVASQSMSPSWCETNGNDIDLDGIDDHCEYRLAYSFRPRMVSYQGDPVYTPPNIDPLTSLEGEPYYAVEKIGGRYRVVYLLAYYEDYGNPVDGVWCAWPFCPGDDDRGHLGDSEFVALDLTYDNEYQRWMVYRAYGSRHYKTSNGPRWLYHTKLSYSENSRWYPDFWVAKGKHANYQSKRACDAYIGDECPYPVYRWRVPAGQYWNIGSRERPMINCVGSRDATQRTLFGRNGTECFWNNSAYFSGWTNEPGVTGYGVILQSLGF